MRWYRSLVTLSMAIALAAAAAPLTVRAQAPRPAQAPPPGGPAQGEHGPGPMRVAQAKPYKALAITVPKAPADPGLEAFRKQLGDIASRKDRAALAALVAPRVFLMGEQGDKADKKKSGIDNLAAAIDLDGADGAGWDMLAAAAKDHSAEPLQQRQGVLCAPATPTFDGNAFEQLMKSTNTDPFEWGYPNAPQVDVRATSAPGGPVVEKLGSILVRILPEEGDGQSAPSGPPTSLRIVTPAGKTGYVAVDSVLPLASDQICYSKDAGGWKITGYIGGD